MDKQDYRKNKKEIKKKYKQNKKSLKRNFILEKELLKSQYSKPNDKQVINPPKRSVLEEIGNAITHGLGSVFAIVAVILMLKESDNNIKVLSSIIYFCGLFIMFTVSCLYHSFKYGTAVKRLFRRFDYSSIYLLIGSTFIPILLIFVEGYFGILFVIIQLIIIIIGITFISIFGPHKLKPLHITLYVTLGWSGLILLPRMICENMILFSYILGGGIIYTLGIIPFVLKKKISHFIWHFFVLSGAVVQFIGIYLTLF